MPGAASSASCMSSVAPMKARGGAAARLGTAGSLLRRAATHKYVSCCQLRGADAYCSARSTAPNNTSPLGVIEHTNTVPDTCVPGAGALQLPRGGEAGRGDERTSHHVCDDVGDARRDFWEVEWVLWIERTQCLFYKQHRNLRESRMAGGRALPRRVLELRNREKLRMQRHWMRRRSCRSRLPESFFVYTWQTLLDTPLHSNLPRDGPRTLVAPSGARPRRGPGLPRAPAGPQGRGRGAAPGGYALQPAQAPQGKGAGPGVVVGRWAPTGQARGAEGSLAVGSTCIWPSSAPPGPPGPSVVACSRRQSPARPSARAQARPQSRPAHPVNHPPTAGPGCHC